MAVLDSYENVLSITPADTDLAQGSSIQAVYVGGAGNLAVQMKSGVDGTDLNVVFVGVPAGTVLKINPIQIRTTSTTATNILALW